MDRLKKKKRSTQLRLLMPKDRKNQFSNLFLVMVLVHVNAWCGGVVSVLDTHHSEIQEEEETGNDITSKSNCKKLALLHKYFFPHEHTHIQPKSNVLIFHTSTVSMTTWLMSSLDDVMIGR